MKLPLWDSELDVEVGPSTYCLLSSHPLSSLRQHGDPLGKIAIGAFALNSEFLYLCGPESGLSGSMVWEAPFLMVKKSCFMPFTIAFGYSPAMEDFLAQFILAHDDLVAGVSICTFWRDSVPLSTCKILALLSATPLIDEPSILESLSQHLYQKTQLNQQLPFYAEQMGFIRAPVLFENEVPHDLMLEQELESLQLEVTREIVGPSPRVPLPPFYGGLPL